MNNIELDSEFKIALLAGQKFYQECESIIYQIAEKIETNYIQFREAYVPVLSVKQLLKRFDYGLQLTIFAAATSDNGKVTQNKITQLDIDFIRNIVFHGDIFTDKVFNITFPSTKTVITWDNILEVSSALGIDNAIIRNMLNCVHPFIQDFIECVTLCDQLELYEEKSFMAQLKEKIEGMPASRSLYIGLDNSHEDFKNFVIWEHRFWTLEEKEKRIMRKISNCLNEAQEYYKKSRAIIAEMTAIACIHSDSLIANNITLLSPQQLIELFDYGLQFTLLQFAATIDGNPICKRTTEFDIEFIKKIVRDGDICVDNIPLGSPDWDRVSEKITQGDVADIHTMLDRRIGLPVGQRFREFVQYLNKVDQITTSGWLSKIEEQVEMILTVFSRLHDSDSCASYARNSDNNRAWLHKLWGNYH